MILAATQTQAPATLALPTEAWRTPPNGQLRPVDVTRFYVERAQLELRSPTDPDHRERTFTDSQRMIENAAGSSHGMSGSAHERAVALETRTDASQAVELLRTTRLTPNPTLKSDRLATTSVLDTLMRIEQRFPPPAPSSAMLLATLTS